MNRDCDKFYKKLDSLQREMYIGIMEKPIVFCNSKAGTGKTTIAVMAGLELLEQATISHIMYIRFPDQLAQSLGYVPGTIIEKEEIYMGPFINACEELGIRKETLFNSYAVDERVIMQTCIGDRGANFKNSLVILDEAQNASFKDLKLELTRLNNTCKCVVIGHDGQIDNNKGRQDHAFINYMNHFSKKDYCLAIELKRNYRGELSKYADSLMIDDKGKYYIEK